MRCWDRLIHVPLCAWRVYSPLGEIDYSGRTCFPAEMPQGYLPKSYA